MHERIQNHGGLAMFVVVQDPGEKSQVFVPRRGGLARKMLKVENFPGGGLSRLAKVYKLLAKMC